jgi:hypothetical protein
MVDGHTVVDIVDEHGVVIDWDMGDDIHCTAPAEAVSNDGVWVCARHAEQMTMAADPDIYIVFTFEIE